MPTAHGLERLGHVNCASRMATNLTGYRRGLETLAWFAGICIFDTGCT